MSLGTAFKAFFAALSSRETATAIRHLLETGPAALEARPPATAATPSPGSAPVSPPRAPAAAAPPRRSEALTLLAMLQREARFVDLIQEPLDQVTDAQVGAAARPCLKQCQQTLHRVFELQPLVEQPEGQPITVPDDASPIRYQWIGERSGTSGGAGRLVHHGWIASRCELAQWTGRAADANVVAPAQVEA